jgi:hypothetical protein
VSTCYPGPAAAKAIAEMERITNYGDNLAFMNIFLVDFLLMFPLMFRFFDLPSREEPQSAFNRRG